MSKSLYLTRTNFLDLKHLPRSLIVFRLCLGPLMVAGILTGCPSRSLAAAVIAGAASDIFDGIIARRLGVATAELRRADSLADVVFWLSVLVVAQQVSGFAERHFLLIGLLLASEAGCQIVSMKRFRRAPATHSYAAKAWGLILTAGFASVLLGRDDALLGSAMLLFGLAVNIEVIAIMMLSERQPIDVPSIIMLAKRSKHPCRRVMFGDRL